MNRKTFSLFPTLSFLALILFAQFALAQNPPCEGKPETVNGIQVQKYICKFINPITQSNDLGKLIKSIFTQLQPFLITIVVLIIIYIGFRITAAAASSSPGELNRWKKALLIALIAAAIIGGGEKIIDAVQLFAEQINRTK